MAHGNGFAYGVGIRDVARGAEHMGQTREVGRFGPEARAARVSSRHRRKVPITLRPTEAGLVVAAAVLMLMMPGRNA